MAQEEMKISKRIVKLSKKYDTYDLTYDEYEVYFSTNPIVSINVDFDHWLQERDENRHILEKNSITTADLPLHRIDKTIDNDEDYEIITKNPVKKRKVASKSIKSKKGRNNGICGIRENGDDKINESDKESSEMESNMDIDDLDELDVSGAGTTTDTAIEVYDESEWISETIVEDNYTRLSVRKTLPNEDVKLVTPPMNEVISKKLDIFEKFFDDSIISTFLENSNSYGSYDNENWENINDNDFKAFLGIILYMGVSKKPSRKFYWHSKYGDPIIKKIMSKEKFEKILQNWRWVNSKALEKREIDANNAASSFWKVSSFLEKLADNCRLNSTYLGRNINIDEMCIQWKGRKEKQYNPKKPKKWHFKVFCLNDSETGFLSNFFIYDAKKMKQLGTSSTFYPITKLLEPQQYQHKWHNLFTDNWYTSYNVAKYCLSIGMHFAGTIKPKRKFLPKTKLLKKSGKLRKQRGFMQSYRKGNESIYLTEWQDKNPVRLLATFPTMSQEISRKDTKNGIFKPIRLKRPTVIKHYNKHMGGTDLMDQRLANYNTTLKTNAWQIRMFSHFLLVAAVNSFLLYRQLTGSNITYLKFLLLLFHELCNDRSTVLGSASVNTLIGDENLRFAKEKACLQNNSRLTGAHYPTMVRDKDGIGRGKCAVCKKCNRSMYCPSCGKHFCVEGIKENNCFFRFHYLQDFRKQAINFNN